MCPARTNKGSGRRLTCSCHDRDDEEQPRGGIGNGGVGQHQEPEHVHGDEDADDTQLSPTVNRACPQRIDQRSTHGVCRCDDSRDGVRVPQGADHEHDAEAHHRDGQASDEGRAGEPRSSRSPEQIGVRPGDSHGVRLVGAAGHHVQLGDPW